MEKIDKKAIPHHIAIIMDGNRRWADKRDLDANKGHEEGARNLDRIVERCKELGVKNLTVYTLSTENWRKRTTKEVAGIFDLLLRIVKEKKEDYEKEGIKLFVLGNFQAFPRRVARAISEMLKIVLKNERIKVNLALNYGGRDEIVRAIKEIIKEGVPADKVNEELVSKHLYTNGQPDPDLIIRTGGEVRLSNFLLWQLSYSELYFTDTLWPDFGPKELDRAILEYQRRQRRFGK
ncbi:di-trans,poly-cis-decaprenylcistransferase [Candidatus Microgenomates bacterium]|jgi:undecaprenyl diphosphate synthase|nr:MAG: di-trans,poly-cis-decaprenylcistransferase [Candidatus Microgenomates bacterium]